MPHNHKLNCKQCGKSFEAERRRAYCSAECRPSRNRPSNWTPLAKATNQCAICGASFETHITGRKYCSRACNMKAFKARNTRGYLLEPARIVAKEFKRRKAMRDISLRKQGSIRRKADMRRKRLAHSCACCGVRLDGVRLNITYCIKCSADRLATQRRAAKSLRRARKRSTKVEGVAIDPIAIFERDGWLCHLCGGKTLKAKRGTMHDKAPQLDHIIPLAKGGSHTEGNLACSHGRCNLMKSDKILGQPSLLVLCN